MGLPEYIKQILDESKYSIGLGQVIRDRTDVNQPPKASSISVSQDGKRLGTVHYDCETGAVRVETAISDTVINQQFLDYLIETLQDVGKQGWKYEPGRSPILPEPLGELFEHGRKYA